MGERQEIRERMDRMTGRLVKNGMPAREAERVSRDAARRADRDGKAGELARKDRRQRQD